MRQEMRKRGERNRKRITYFFPDSPPDEKFVFCHLLMRASVSFGKNKKFVFEF